MTGPLVSVIIPAYHAEKFIARALDSVKKQTFRDFEVILVVDDFQHDRTGDIAAEYLPKLNIIPVFSEKKTSPANARNRAIERAEGKYLAFLDADDEWLPHHLANAISFLTQNPGIQVYYGMCVNILGEPVGFHGRPIENINQYCTAPHSAIVCVNPPPALFDERLAAADDYLWLLEMHRKGVKFHFNPKLESNYHMHGGNLTGEAPGFWRQMFQVHWYDKTPGWDCLTMKAPTDIQVEPTTRCGLKCKMCIRSADQEIRDITPETLWKILTAHPESRLVKLQGLGEPFMHPQLDILAMMVRAAGKYAITITNGQPENVVPWSRYFNEVMFSLDYIKGPAPASAHEGSPKKVIGKILEIKEKYPEVNLTINQVISADTRDRDICDVETFCSDHCIKLIRNRIANWHSNPSKGIAEMVALDRAIHGPLDPFDPHCPWGFTWAYYDARGRLHPCCVRMSDEYLMDGGWNDPAMQEFRRQRLDGGCETCKRCPD